MSKSRNPSDPPTPAGRGGPNLPRVRSESKGSPKVSKSGGEPHKSGTVKDGSPERKRDGR
jgi:hypothetical protein